MSIIPTAAKAFGRTELRWLLKIGKFAVPFGAGVYVGAKATKRENVLKAAILLLILLWWVMKR